MNGNTDIGAMVIGQDVVQGFPEPDVSYIVRLPPLECPVRVILYKALLEDEFGKQFCNLGSGAPAVAGMNTDCLTKFLYIIP